MLRSRKSLKHLLIRLQPVTCLSQGTAVDARSWLRRLSTSGEALSGAGTSTVSSQATGTTSESSNPVEARYLQLIASGHLRRDEGQWRVVQRLGKLHDSLAVYREQLDAYEATHAQYQASRQSRLLQLQEQEEQRQRELAAQQQQQQAQQQQAQTSSSSWSPMSWLSSVMPGGDKEQKEKEPRKQRELTPEQRAKLQAAQHEAQVLKELGHPPVPPPAPKGLYVHGSVGSGKSLVMDMFYDVVLSGDLLPYHRRMHFNAALLEMHSRLHKLDQEHAEQTAKEVEQRQQAGGSAGAAAAATAAAGAGMSRRGGGQALWAMINGRNGNDQSEESDDEDEDDGEVDEDHKRFAAAVAAAGVAAAAKEKSSNSVFKFFDEGVARQKAARKAMLAVRKYLRMQRAGRVPKEVIAKANSDFLKRAAAEMLRGFALAGLDAGQPAPKTTVDGRMAGILCFDEMQVPDVFSAAALKALVETAAAQGCVLITTSNRAPHELPRHGLHEDMFGHFIDTMTSACDVVELSAHDDYRRLLMEGILKHKASASGAVDAPPPPPLLAVVTAAAPQQQLRLPHGPYLQPAGPTTHAALEELWEAVTAQAARPAPLEVPVMFGRTLPVPLGTPCGVARFSFADLCASPLGPADYVALAQHFHTVFITDVPAMSMQVRDQARRFITLVDELYNARRTLVVSAAAAPEALFMAVGEEPILDLESLQFESAVEGSKLRRNLMSDGGVAPVAAAAGAAASMTATLGGMEERFAFQRAVSRLYEMQSGAWNAHRYAFAQR